MTAIIASRRHVLAGTGALIVSFSSATKLLGEAARQGGPEQTEKPPLPGSLKANPRLDSWVRIKADGSIAIFTGKAELGQGIKTALLQIAAEQLDVPLASLKLITADTSITPNEGFTAGSRSMQDSGSAILHAAAQARAILLATAGERLGVAPSELKTQNGTVIAPSGSNIRYGELVSDELLEVEAQPQSHLKEPGTFRIIGNSAQRVDIPAKVTGGEAYVHDLRLPGMVHARVVRPPSYGARLVSVSTDSVKGMVGVLKVVRDGDFLAVIAEREFQAIKAMRKLAANARWDEKARLPRASELPSFITSLEAEDTVILDRGQPQSADGKRFEATFTRPYQVHGSIGPSCAVARSDHNGVTVWTHSQGVYPDQQAIAELLRLPTDQVRCIHMEGSGCYGHNGADDAAADAALISRSLPDRPVRVQWMREQEHGWEPFGPAMVTKVSAVLDRNGRIADWNYAVWSNTHSMRPGGAGSLLAGQHLAQPFSVPVPKPIPQPEGGGDRNAIPLYSIPNARVVHHFLPAMPVRVSALRALGAYMNVFSIESFMDELARAADDDPVEFRLRHLDDVRARDVVTKASEIFGWRPSSQRHPGHGHGFAFARYKNLAAYCAIAAAVEVDRDTGRVWLVRAVAAIDSGQAVNPDGLINQVEGAILQSASWTLYESVSFDNTRITSVDWSTYPILRFNAVPDSIEVHVIDRPGQPFLGSGECGQGPAAAAIANAVADATGQRLRDLPLTRGRIKAAWGT
jgi:CO/xanthine dehydrogenase Mo-binding subunit